MKTMIPDIKFQWTTFLKQLTENRSDERVPIDGAEYDPTEITTKADVTQVLGLTVREFVEGILVNNGGWIPQQLFTEYTNWSESLVSRILQDLENEKTIVRFPAGREKIVCLPDQVREIDAKRRISEESSTEDCRRIIHVPMDEVLTYVLTGTRGGITRLHILHALDKRPRTATHLARDLDDDLQTTHHHLGVLMDNDIVRKNSENPNAIYLLTKRANDQWEAIEKAIDRVE